MKKLTLLSFYLPMHLSLSSSFYLAPDWYHLMRKRSINCLSSGSNCLLSTWWGFIVAISPSSFHEHLCFVISGSKSLILRLLRLSLHLLHPLIMSGPSKPSSRGQAWLVTFWVSVFSPIWFDLIFDNLTTNFVKLFTAGSVQQGYPVMLSLK